MNLANLRPCAQEAAGVIELVQLDRDIGKSAVAEQSGFLSIRSALAERFPAVRGLCRRYWRCAERVVGKRNGSDLLQGLAWKLCAWPGRGLASAVIVVVRAVWGVSGPRMGA